MSELDDETHSLSAAKEANIRYSQMSEEEAAQQFEKRRQLLMQGLQRQHQLLTKKGEKPPRHNSAKVLKHAPMQSNDQQGQFIIFKQPSSQQSLIQKKPSKQPAEQTSFTKEDRIQTAKKSLPTPFENNSIQKIRSSNTKRQIVKNYDSAKQEPNLQEASETKQPPPKPYPEPSPVKQIKYDGPKSILKSINLSATNKQHLLGEIGNLEIEIKRLAMEQLEVGDRKSQTPQAKTGQRTPSKDPKNQTSGPYYELRKKDKGSQQQLRESRASSQKQSSQRSSSHDVFNRGINYAAKAQQRKTLNDSIRKESNKSPNHRKSNANPSDTAKQSTAEPMKPLNITIQFQQSIDNSRNLFSPTVQFEKKQQQKESDREVATDRKKQVTKDTSPRQQSLKKDKELAKQTVQAFAMSMFNNPSLKSLQPFEDRIKKLLVYQNYLSKTTVKAPTPQPRPSDAAQSSSFYNLITLGQDDTNSTKSQVSNQKRMIARSNQVSFQGERPKGVDAQIDEAVKLYNNLKQLINCKASAPNLRPHPQQQVSFQRKLTTIEYFDNTKTIQQKELKDGKALDMPLRPKNLFFNNFNDSNIKKPNVNQGQFRKFEELKDLHHTEHLSGRAEYFSKID